MRKKLISIIISILLLVSFVCTIGCDCSDEEVLAPFADTGIELANNGSTNYKVVIPVNADEYEKYAAEELVLFFKQSTGATLPVVTDSGIAFNEDDYVISIGNTTILDESKIVIDYDELGRDGYKVVRKGNTVILAGGGGDGDLYAVYGFLNKQVEWKAYGNNEIYVKEVSKLNLLNFDWTDVPDFPNRAGGYFFTYNDKVFAARSRTFVGNGTSIFAPGSIWGMFAETSFRLLPPEIYKEDHRDWYAEGHARQLCLSNMEMRDALIENLKEQILANQTSWLWSVGQEDGAWFCHCKNCSAIAEKYRNSGLMMQFINYVADAIEEWRQEVCPEREIMLTTFAYQLTSEPPVEKDEDGNYRPIDESVIPHENVTIMMAPMYCDYMVPYGDAENNPETARMFEGWRAVTDRFAIWSYCNNFSESLEFFDNMNAIATNYQMFRDMGAIYMYDESGGGQRQAFAFQPMMAFIHSELMWDCDQNVNDLIDDFLLHYYKEAYKPMRDYYDLISNYISVRKIELGEQNDTFYGTAIFNDEGETKEAETLLNPEFWSKQVLEQMLALFDEANAIIDQCYTGGQKDVMKDRLLIESLTPRKYLLNLYKDYINPTECLKMIDDFERDAGKFGISSIVNRRNSLEQDIEIWRKDVLGN